MSPTPEDNAPNTPIATVDLWVELDRLGRDDRDMIAQRRADVRRSRLARRAIAALTAAKTAS